jgi:formate hydrogenlyase subunit 6/NADH:ubiquinone oxidoreductase subunit I
MLRPKWPGLKRKGVVTTSYPDEDHIAYEGSLGMPEVDTHRCELDGSCARVCPTKAIALIEGSVMIDLGLCIFCAECVRACPHSALRMSRMYEMANKNRKALEVQFFVR